MQLNMKPRAGPRSSLAAATLTLLGASAPDAQALEGPGQWDIDTGVLVYSEFDGRVQAVEPVVKATRALGEDRAVTVKVVLDTLTGASPNGASPASRPQTFSGPSGGGKGYTAEAYATPLDHSFKDTRVALSGDYSLPVSANGKLDLGLNASKEYDFTSAAGSLHYSIDLFRHNTTLSGGVNYESDTIEAVGGAPEPLALMSPAGAAGGESEGEGESEGPASGSASRRKTVTDFVVGLTQVLGPLTLVQVNYSLSQSQGYHTDPYKILSVVGVDGEPLRYVYEGRPEARNKQAVFARIKRFMFARDVFDLSYRYMSDDWGVASHTAELTYRLNLGDRNFMEPHLRGYTQTAADFYRAALFDGEEARVGFASADPRLGAFDGYTGGLKVGHTLDSGSHASVRLEYYRQSGKREGVPAQASAAMEKFKLEPDLSAVMLTVGFRFKP